MDDNDFQPNMTTPAGMGGAMPDTATAAPVQPQVQQQAPPVDPAAVAQIQHDSAFGRMAKAILGQQNQYSVGPDGTLQNNPVPEKPGQLFRSILGAALLGGAAGANGNPAQGLAGGLVHGGAAEVQNTQQQDQQKQAQAQQDFKNQQLVNQQTRETQMANAQVANMHSEMVARDRRSDLEDQDAHDKHNAASAALEKTLISAGGTPAVIPVNGEVKTSMTAPDLAAAYVKDPSILKGPNGFVRHFIDSTDSSELTYNGKNWVDASGEPVNMSDKTTVKAIDVPIDVMNKTVAVSGVDINKAAGYRLVDPAITAQVSPLGMDNINAKRLQGSREQALIDHQKHQDDTADAELGLRKQELGIRYKELADKEAQSGVDAKGDPTTLAKDIASGHVTVDRLGYLLSKNPDLIAGVMKVDPNFDSSKAQAYPTVYKDFTSSKPNTAGGTLNAAATAFKHLSELQDLNTAASRIPGTDAHQRYENKVDTVAAEIAKVYSDSTIPGIAGYKSTLNATFNRDAAIQTQAQSMGDKVDSLAQTWKNAAPSSVYEAKMPGIDEDAINARAKLDPKYKARLESGQPTPTPHFSHVSASGKFGYDDKSAKWVPIPGK